MQTSLNTLCPATISGDFINLLAEGDSLFVSPMSPLTKIPDMPCNNAKISDKTTIFNIAMTFIMNFCQKLSQKSSQFEHPLCVYSLSLQINCYLKGEERAQSKEYCCLMHPFLRHHNLYGLR